MPVLQPAQGQGKISALDEGDLRPDQVKHIATRLGVTEQDVIDMNRRLGGDASLNAPLRKEGEGEWQDWLVDDSASQEQILVAEEEGQNRLAALRDALSVLNPRERRISRRRLSDDPITLEELSTEFGVSRERVRQIEVRAFEKIQEAVKRNLAQRERRRADAGARRLAGQGSGPAHARLGPQDRAATRSKPIAPGVDLAQTRRAPSGVQLTAA
jgi:RNA polymerase sigma-32 factor